MADVSKVTTPNGNEYDIKDVKARGVDLTSAEYWALVNADEDDPDTNYHLTDAPSVSITPELISNIASILYPVGSIYMSTSNVNPGTYIPNTTWSRVLPANACERIQNLTNVATGTTTEKSFTVTTTGNPVLLAFDADANPLAASAVWFSLYIDRDGSRIATRTVQCSGGNSYNGDGGIVYLDKSVSAGKHLYKFTVYVGVGPISFQESGAAEAPCCTLIELGYPTGQYAWKRTA